MRRQSVYRTEPLSMKPNCSWDVWQTAALSLHLFTLNNCGTDDCRKTWRDVGDNMEEESWNCSYHISCKNIFFSWTSLTVFSVRFVPTNSVKFFVNLWFQPDERHLLMSRWTFLRFHPKCPYKTSCSAPFHSQKCSQRVRRGIRKQQTRLSVSVVLLEELKLLENMNPSEQLYYDTITRKRFDMKWNKAKSCMINMRGVMWPSEILEERILQFIVGESGKLRERQWGERTRERFLWNRKLVNEINDQSVVCSVKHEN